MCWTVLCTTAVSKLWLAAMVDESEITAQLQREVRQRYIRLLRAEGLEEDYDPEWSETEASEVSAGVQQDAAEHSSPLTEAINASVSAGTMPTERSEVDERRRAAIAALLQQRLQGECPGHPVAGVGGHLGAYASASSADGSTGHPGAYGSPVGQPISTTSATLRMTRTVWRQGVQVSECSVRVLGKVSPASSNMPWRLRADAALLQPCSDFGLAAVVSPELQRSASQDATAAAAGISLRPRGQVVLPPRRSGPSSTATQVPDAGGLTWLPPRPSTRTSSSSRTGTSRAAPYALPGAESSREERATAAAALGMSRRYYETVVLGMER
eukprot:s891_g21.t1